MGTHALSTGARRVLRLKTVQPYFDHVLADLKPFEIRKDDRGYEVGVVLVLDEYDPERGYSGRYTVREVTYLVRGVYGLPEDVCVMTVRPTYLSDAEHAALPRVGGAEGSGKASISTSPSCRAPQFRSAVTDNET